MKKIAFIYLLTFFFVYMEWSHVFLQSIVSIKYYTIKIITPYGVKRDHSVKKSKILLEMEWKLTTSSKSLLHFE